MIKISKTFTFDMAHLLENHPAKCKNLHGHTYKMIVTVGCNNLDNDMVIDFKELKAIVQENVIDKLDHAFAYNKNSDLDYVLEIVKILKEHNLKVYGFETRTTCEQMVKVIWDILNKEFTSHGLTLIEIDLYEGEGSCARYNG